MFPIKGTAIIKRTILVVDDEKDSLAVIKGMLENHGYRVHAFDNPLLALQHVQEEGCSECSIVISDIRMPGMTGLELVKHLKKLRPDLSIVLITAFPVRKEEWQKVLPSIEACGFIKKPFSISEIIEAIERCEKELTQ